MIRKFLVFKSSTSGSEVFEKTTEQEFLEDEGPQNETEEDEEERHEVLETWTWREHEAWLAGVIARHAEDAGLIAKTDQFDWEYHQEFDADIHEAEQKAAQASEGQTGENVDAGGSPDASSSADSGSSSGNEVGGDLGSDFGSSSFGEFGGFSGGNPSF